MRLPTLWQLESTLDFAVKITKCSGRQAVCVSGEIPLEKGFQIGNFVIHSSKLRPIKYQVRENVEEEDDEELYVLIY